MKCPVCGKYFIPRRSSRYCSKRCRQKDIKCICQTCGKEFRGVSGVKYCSDECRYSVAEKICPVCGVTFKGRPNRVYCSVKCKSRINAKKFYSKPENAGKGREYRRRYYAAHKEELNLKYKVYRLTGEWRLPT